MEKFNNIWEPVYRKFKNEHPYLAEKVVDWYPSGQMELTFKVENGDKFSYDFISGNTRRLYSPRFDIESESEELWRIDFSTKLINKMRHFGMNQETLSELTGISQITISKYINGKVTPSAYNLDKIAIALKCSPSEFLHNH